MSVTPVKASDIEALNQIQKLLSGNEWDADTTCSVAEIIRSTGRDVDEIVEPR